MMTEPVASGSRTPPTVGTVHSGHGPPTVFYRGRAVRRFWALPWLEPRPTVG